MSRSPLNRDAIAGAALRMIDADGLPALSMRRLGTALGVEAMALYHHFRNKEALLDAVMDRLLDEVEAGAAELPPLDRLRATMRSYRSLALRHPHAFPLLTGRRLATERAFEFHEQLLRQLAAAGLDPFAAACFFRLIDNYVGGSGLADIAGRTRSDAATPVRHEQADGVARYPHAAAIAPHLRASNLDVVFEFGLDAIFDALRGHVAAHPVRGVPAQAAKRRRRSRIGAAQPRGSPGGAADA
jgi:AcrR family transcriptional regulator